MADDHSLGARLAAAGVEPGATPVEAWRQLHAVEGSRATVIDLYELAARARGVTVDDLSLADRTTLARSVMPDVWPGFEVTDGSYRAGDVIRIVEYDEQWPQQFQRWRAVVKQALGDTALRIEHVGSTAVPGLAAKPIIDLQVSVADLDDESKYVAQLEEADLQLRSRDGYHRYFRPFAGRPRDVHVHVCANGSEWEREHLLFRDYLRSHSPARDEYAAAKRRAATRWSDDGIAYTDAKTEVVLRLLEAAEQWSDRPE